MFGIWNRPDPRGLPFPVRKFLVAGFFAFTVFFQVFQVSRFRPLYFVLKLLFIAEIVLLAWEFIRLCRKDKVVLLILLLVIGVRLPFLLHSDGLMFTSDNAMEAIQAWEIKDTRAVPFYLLDTLPQHGVMKHMMIAFVWDALGVSYSSFVLFQVLLYFVFLYLVAEILLRTFDRRTVVLLLLSQFAFIEVIFDCSLFLRSGTYLEMLVVSLLGVALFDFRFRDPKRLFLSGYFLLFAFSLNPFAVFLALPLAATATASALRRLRGGYAWLAFGSGLLAGALVPVYRRIYLPPPPATGDWFQVKLISLSRLAPVRWPDVLARLVQDARLAFGNMLGFEFDYSQAIAPRFEFRPESQAARTALGLIHETLVILAAAALALGFFLALRRLWASRKSGFRDLPWMLPFYFFLIGTFGGRLVLLSPKPYLEPRHNLDLALILVISLAWIAEASVRRRPLRAAGTAAVVAGFLLFAFPQAYFFYKTTLFKEFSYSSMLTVLSENRIRYLATDFTIAYCLHFLSGRDVLVTDSIGPLTMSFNLSQLTRAVDAVPADRKAYLLYSEKYPPTDVMFRRIPTIRSQVLKKLKDLGSPYRVVDLRFYELIIPLASRGTAEEAR